MDPLHTHLKANTGKKPKPAKNDRLTFMGG